MTWIQTANGKKFDLANPRPEDVDIEDIAHALSQMCRYAGHTKAFYSVAQHSVHVSNVVCRTPRNVEERELALWGLLHDASEAYCVDVPRPLKNAPGMAFYRDVEKAVQRAVCRRFGLSNYMPLVVKRADDQLLATEQPILIGPQVEPWHLTEQPLDEPGLIANLRAPFSPAMAKHSFLERAYSLLEMSF